MEGISKRRYQSVLLFSVLAVLVIGIFYGAYRGPWDKSFRNRMEQRFGTFQKELSSRMQNDKMTLICGQPLSTEKLKLIYHGLEKGRLKMAIYILELDPESAYHYQLPIKEAKKGFRIGGQNFVLESYGKNQIQLRLRNN